MPSLGMDCLEFYAYYMKPPSASITGNPLNWIKEWPLLKYHLFRHFCSSVVIQDKIAYNFVIRNKSTFWKNLCVCCGQMIGHALIYTKFAIVRLQHDNQRYNYPSFFQNLRTVERYFTLNGFSENINSYVTTYRLSLVPSPSPKLKRHSL